MSFSCSKSMRSGRQSSRVPGFTLVELLVVIGIIALLIGILLPTLSRARAEAQKTQCLSNLRQLASANIRYSVDFQGWYAPIRVGYNTNPDPNGQWPDPAPIPAGLPQPSSTTVTVWYAISQFRSALGVEPFPADASRYPAGMMCPKATMANEVGTWAPNKNGYVIGRSYGANTTGLDTWMLPPAYHLGWKAGAQIKQAEAKIMFADSPDWNVSGYAAGRYETTLEDYGPPLNGQSRSNQIAFRHNDGACMAFFDGHAEWRHKYDIYDKTDTAATKRGWRKLWDVKWTQTSLR